MAAFLWRFYDKIFKQIQPMDKTSLRVINSTIYVNDEWKPEDNFVSATDKNGKTVNFSQVKVSGRVDTSRAGTYTITYSYGGKTATLTLTVEATVYALVLSDDKTEVNFLGKTWSVISDNSMKLGEKNYLITLQEKISDNKFVENGTYYFATNDRNVDTYTTSVVKAKIDEWYAQNIQGKVYEHFVEPVILPNPTLGDLLDLGINKSNTR